MGAGLVRQIGIVWALFWSSTFLAPCVFAQGQTGVVVAWNPSVTTDVTGYNVYSGVASQTYTNVIATPNVTNATIPGLVPGTTYFFSVTAVDSQALESPLSNEITYTVPTTSAPPTISTIANQTTLENTPTMPIAFTVGDLQTPSSNLAVSADSSNPTLVPVSNIVLTGSGANRTVTVTPASNQIGTATITLTVSDGSLSTSTNFLLLVVNPQPTIALTSPADGGSYAAPATLSLSASVTANGHSITKVQFYNGTTLLGEATAAPYAFTWSNVAAGSYSLTAEALYDGGVMASSAAANVTVTNPPPAITLNSPIDGSSYTAPATIGLAANVIPNGHSVNKVQFYTGNNLLAEVAAAPYSFNWTNVSAGNYSVTAQAIYDGSSRVVSAPASITVIGLPPPWQTADIGNPGVAGSASFSNGLYSVQGAGNISGYADNFTFLYQGLSGDGEIRAQIVSIQNTGGGGCLGVMIRESPTSGSRYGFMGISPGGTFRWQRRSNTGGGTSCTKSGTGAPPNVWARLVRRGNTISGYKSTDGANWALVNSSTISMATNIYIGLAVASGSTSALNTGTFANVTLVP